MAIGYDGKATQGSKRNDLNGVKTDTGFKVDFGKIDTAYRIKYTTDIEDNSKAPFTNNALLADEGIEKGRVSSTIDEIRTGLLQMMVKMDLY